MRHVWILFLLAGMIGPAAAADPQSIGAVARLQAQASATRDGTTRPLTVSQSIFTNDLLRTGPDARLELRLSDASVLTLGENAELAIEDFANEMLDSRMRFRVAGPFRFISGIIPRRNREGVRFATPHATIGIRGTEFWGGPFDGYSILVIEGAITVENGAGRVVLDQEGQGTVIPTADTAPGAPRVWDGERIGRAVRTVTFRN